MEARRLSLVSDFGDGEEDGSDGDECLSVAVWAFGLALGPAQALAYAYLYGETLGRGRHCFDCDMGDLIKIFNRDRRTIEGWLAALEAQPAGLIRTAADPLTGRLRITAYRPTSFAPRRTTKRGRDPQQRLPGVEDGPGESGAAEFEAATTSEAGMVPVSPFEETKGQARPTDVERVEAGAARTAAPPHDAAQQEPASESLAASFERAIGPAGKAGESSGVCAQKPPDASGVFAHKPPQKPPDDVLAIQQSLERRRSQAFRARLGGAQKPPAHELLRSRSKISVSVLRETINRDLRSAPGDFARKPPDDSPSDGPTVEEEAVEEGAAEYGAGLPLWPLVRLIQRDVGPSLHSAVALRIARALLEGHLDGVDVERAIVRSHDLVADGRCNAPFVYFVGAMQSKFAELGIAWHSRGPH